MERLPSIHASARDINAPLILQPPATIGRTLTNDSDAKIWHSYRFSLPFFLLLGVPNRHAVLYDTVTGNAPPQAIKTNFVAAWFSATMIRQHFSECTAMKATVTQKQVLPFTRMRVRDEQVVDRTPDRKACAIGESNRIRLSLNSRLPRCRAWALVWGRRVRLCERE
jgi:hypothetical protein